MMTVTIGNRRVGLESEIGINVNTAPSIGSGLALEKKEASHAR